MDHTLSLLVHGESKTGKSWLGDTTPAPRLILDAEGGTNWTPSPKIKWDPLHDPPPALGDWETCVVTVRDFATVQRVYQWLNVGEHPFKSLVVDSISEIQKRCKDSIVGVNPMQIQNWGELLTHMESLIRDMRDLTMHPTHPLQCVMIIAFTRESAGKMRPYVQGQLAITLPYFLDVIGYLFVQQLDDGTKIRRLLVSSHDRYEAGERVGGRLGAVVDNPNVVKMIEQVYPENPGEG